MSRTRSPSPTSLERVLPHIPPGWERVRVGDVADLQPGFAFKSTWYLPKGVRLLRGINISPGGARWDDAVSITPEQAAEFGDYLLFPGDIVIAMDRPVISSGIKIARLSESDTPSLLVQRVGRFRPLRIIDPKILLAFLNSPIFLQHIGVHATGTQLPHISGSDIESAPLALPPLNEQRRIVAKIDALQARSRRAREALEAIPALLDRFRQSVLAAAFRGDLTAEWRAAHPDVEPASVLLERIRAERKARWIDAEAEKARARAEAKAKKAGKPWTAKDDAAALKRERANAAKKYEEPAPVDPVKEGLPELPEGWCWTRIEMVGEVLLGRQRAPQYMTGQWYRPYLRVANIRDDSIDFGDVFEMDFDPEQFERYKLQPGDILVSEGQSLHLVGQSAIYRGGIEGLCFQKSLHRFRPFTHGPSSEFAQLLFRAWVKTGFFQRYASITTNIAHLTLANFSRCPFPLPPLAEQEVLQMMANRLLAAGVTLRKMGGLAHEKLAELDQSLLAKAFRGELVPQDPADEPASQLLKRIQAERATTTDAKPKRAAAQKTKKTTAKRTTKKST